jgi:hypothetical protein
MLKPKCLPPISGTQSGTVIPIPLRTPITPFIALLTMPLNPLKIPENQPLKPSQTLLIPL